MYVLNPGKSFAVPAIILIAILAGAVQVQADTCSVDGPGTHIRAGRGGTIVAIHPPATTAARTVRAPADYQFPQPRIAGFSPLVAITTSDEALPLGANFEFEHELQYSYVGSHLNQFVSRHFVIGYVDSGSDADFAAGVAADTLGIDFNLGPNHIPITGVGGDALADITLPVAFFAAGLSAVNVNGTLDYGQVVGHSNVSGLRLPSIDCGGTDAVTAVVGMPFLAFYNTYVNVDTPRKVTIDGVTYQAPDVQIEPQDPFSTLPPLAHRISMSFADGYPRTTANYYPELDDFLEGPPFIPTMMSVAPGLLPLGGLFTTTILVLEGEPGSTNPAIPVPMMLDTGAQTSILSQRVADDLSLPFTPDFTVDVCGVGGLVEGIPGYYIDYVKISAGGGALEFSQAPFVIIPDFPFDGVLGMNFFWNRNVIFEPRLDGSSSFHVSDPIPVPYGDDNVDFDVDSDDAAAIFSCWTGAGVPFLLPECAHFDGDFDGDIDLGDFFRFQDCFSGIDSPADPTCGE